MEAPPEHADPDSSISLLPQSPVATLSDAGPIQSTLVNEALLIAGLREHELRGQAENLAEECKRLLDIANNASLVADNANRTKDIFLASLSHELRTPLNPALLLASEGALNPNLSDDVRQDFAAIEKNILLEAQLIDELLDFTKITRSKIALTREMVSLNEVLKDALANVQDEFNARNLSLSVKMFSGNPLVDGESTRLQQVFWNVLKNAAKFTANGGRISVVTSTDSARNMLIMEIIDSGIGIDPSEIEKIFEPFKQVDPGGHLGTHKFGGLGLGLAIAKSIVELHSGTIRAESKGIGFGTTFIIELPLAFPAGSSPQTIAGTQRVSVSGPTVGLLRLLLVEDDADSRTALARLLAARNFSVSSVGTFSDARRLGLLHHIDLLISDIGLPDGNGLDLLEICARKSPLIRGIAISGFGMESDINSSKAAKFAVHLVKPIGVEALEAALRTAMEARSPFLGQF